MARAAPRHAPTPAPVRTGSAASLPVLVAALAAILAATAPVPLRAQQDAPPAGNAPAGEAPPEAWKVQLELGFNGASGNASFAILRTGLTATHLRTDVAEVELTGLFRYGQSEGEVIARDWKAGVKTDLRPGDVWSPFLFATASSDAVRRLDLRTEGGAGAKYTFWREESGEASVSLAALYSYEDFDQQPGVAELSARHTARWSLRNKARKTFGDTDLRHVSFFKPAWDEIGDYVVEVTSSVATRLVGDLALAVEHEYLRDGTPPPQVERDDHKLSVVFRYVL